MVKREILKSTSDMQLNVDEMVKLLNDVDEMLQELNVDEIS